MGHMARVEGVDDYDYYNGILISENYVLSIADVDRPVKKLIILGDLNVVHSDVEDNDAKILEVIEEITHPKFKESLSYDVSLLKLNETIKFDENIRPVCLPQPDSYISQRIMEIGWTDTSVCHKDLRNMKLNLISNAECNEEIMNGGYEEYAEGVANDINFCAVPNVNDRNMCGGFGGAAVLNDHFENTNLNQIVGITSGNAGCDQRYPHIIVRLSSHIDWIESIVWPREIESNDGMETPTFTYFEESIEFIKYKEPSTEFIEAGTTSTEDASTKVDFLMIFVLLLLILLCLLLMYLLVQCFRILRRYKS